MSPITLLDGSLKLKIYFDEADRDFDDDICLCFIEDCIEEEKVLRAGADEVSIYLTPEQAALIILELNRALDASRQHSGRTE